MRQTCFGSINEGLVEEQNGAITYSLLVESSFVSLDFSFQLEPQDLVALKSNSYRNAVLFNVLHTLIQNTFGPQLAATGVAPSEFTQKQFREVVSIVLHSNDAELSRFIAKFSADQHIALDVLAKRQVARRSK